MATTKTRSKFQALRYNTKYIQFKPKGTGVILHFSFEFMRFVSSCEKSEAYSDCDPMG